MIKFSKLDVFNVVFTTVLRTKFVPALPFSNRIPVFFFFFGLRVSTEPPCTYDRVRPGIRTRPNTATIVLYKRAVGWFLRCRMQHSSFYHNLQPRETCIILHSVECLLEDFSSPKHNTRATLCDRPLETRRKTERAITRVEVRNSPRNPVRISSAARACEPVRVKMNGRTFSPAGAFVIILTERIRRNSRPASNRSARITPLSDRPPVRSGPHVNVPQAEIPNPVRYPALRSVVAHTHTHTFYDIIIILIRFA